MQSKYHWKRDYHDESAVYAHQAPAFKLLEATALPTSADLTKFCSAVEDQGQLGSCTGNALVGAMEYLENKSKEFEANGKFVDLSRLFVYYNERTLEGTVNKDNGAQISDGVKTLATQGVCTEFMWPYAIHRFAVKPPATAYTDAATRKITAYARVDRSNGIQGIKQALASGYPIVFGFTVYESFESEDMANTGVLHMPDLHTEQCMGGHAVLMVGYDDTTQRVKVRNSWGANWGQHGYFTMPYAYVTSPSLANDFWTLTK
jgi:C1A family cysteine protease